MSSVRHTLSDALRGWSDERLAALLQARPDLAVPTPQDSVQLASQASSRPSVLRALDQLTVLELAVLDAAVALGGTPRPDELPAAVYADPDQVDAAVTRLRGLALLWEADSGRLRVVSAAADVLGTSVSGLGQSASELLRPAGPAQVALLAENVGLTPSGDRSRDLHGIIARLADRDAVATLVREVDEQARAILTHLVATSSEGRSADASSTVRARDATTPTQHLLARGLLMARDGDHVSVPREVAMVLRGGRTTSQPVGDAPPLAAIARDPTLVDRAAAGAAYELVRHVELLLDQWSHRPPAVLRGSGLGVRDLKASAATMHVDDRTAGLLVEIAAAAGLLAPGRTDELDAAWLPTDRYDAFLDSSLEERWTVLARTWLDSDRLSGLVGSREAGKVVNVLSAGLERSWLPETRDLALRELATLQPGSGLAPSEGAASLVDRLRWLRPRRPTERSPALVWCLDEAATVGVTGLGALSAHGRALLGGGVEDAARALGGLLPAPVDHVLLQADLTAVAPGPLERGLARRLGAVADVESRGGATVYRFTESSVRRAYDVGWSAAEIHQLLASASRTAVPQPLRYLVDDVGRTFGRVRLGAVESFLRSDDEAAMAGLVHDPRAAELRLRLIAPTVVVSDLPVDILLPRLHDLGLAPALESHDGTVRLGGRPSYRARTPAPKPARVSRRATRLAATVTAIRAGDRAASARPARLAEGPAAPTALLAVLREAVETDASVWLAYVDHDGSTVERVVDPRWVEGGWLHALDHRTDDLRNFAVHRILAVHPTPVDA